MAPYIAQRIIEGKIKYEQIFKNKNNRLVIKYQPLVDEILILEGHGDLIVEIK